MKARVTVIIPKMVYGRPMTACPTPVYDAMEALCEATEAYFLGADADTARVVGAAIDALHDAWEEHGG